MFTCCVFQAKPLHPMPIVVISCCRAEGGCTNEYDSEDLQYVRCYVCNQWGHVCCKGAPTEAPVLSCHNCGEQGHLAEECWMTRPTQVGRCQRLTELSVC